MASGTSLQRPVRAHLRERLARCDMESAKLDEALIARENRVLKLESSLSAFASTGAMLRSQAVTLQTALSAARASLKTARLLRTRPLQR